VSVDSVVEGVHFDLSVCSPGDVGWKALMRALSDLAAMGARPLGALVALCVPPGDVALDVMEGVAEASRAIGCPVVGGDVSSAHELVVAVTVLGTVDGATPVARSGAQPGDRVLVSGPLGASEAARRSGGGTAYRRPVCGLSAGWEARLAGAHAMIDVSEGLALDLHRLADASGVGFGLTAVPMAAGATEDEALGGGEDYELVVIFDPADVAGYEERCARAGLRPPVDIGRVVADSAQRNLGAAPLPRMGWQHPIG